MTASVANLLSDQELFRGMGRDPIERLAAHAAPRSLERNEVLFRHGEPAEHFFLVRSGGVVLEVPAISGPTLEVQRLAAGEVLGWSWLIPPYRWNFDARAVEASELLAFDGVAIREACEHDPAFGYAVLKRFSALMSQRLEVARQRMMENWSPPGFA